LGGRFSTKNDKYKKEPMNYEKIKYPDGQISVKLSDIQFPYTVYERINSYEDLIRIKSIAEVLEFNHIKNRHLRIPCLFGQRSDRRFDKLQSFDLKVIADIINSYKFVDVEIFDPHSDVSLALINNSYKKDSFEFVSKVYESENQAIDETIIVSPDAGAYKKCFEYGSKLGCEVVSAIKHRDLNGKISLKFIGDVKDKNCIIVDDLADGGYTFILLSKELRNLGAKRVVLYVSHGYFSKGFEELGKTIDRIYCTNSVKDIENEIVTQFKII